jgi:hypothetical protein
MRMMTETSDMKTRDRLRWLFRGLRVALYIAVAFLASGLVFIVAGGAPISHPTFCDWHFEGGRVVAQSLMIQRHELACDVGGLAIWVVMLATFGIGFGLIENRITQRRWRVDERDRLRLYLAWGCGFPIAIVGGFALFL